ncbi:outer membrane protein OmpA-like peptidoglycan-associated protein [Prosthecobacter fusiformis]|uniref:Outer membrane protein OmpA-like peptidoglycan-associated protein n=1 Tax=Prosthecobacter fusiformis TaxID=48464 RepID=A0A4R7RP88_9BACT|nr:OmpA family protein [Prosthecobacter fusiformis]TDU67300.1 outer membrane protein OmpA-like peptidoglycan-associated protein [Prosthecobacter fusiformis]
MKYTFLLLLTALFPLTVVQAQTAAPLDEELARKSLSARPPRNPVKSSAPVVKRTHERRADKGLSVEVLHRADGSTEEHTFVPLPILFVVNSDQILDDVSRNNVSKLAAVMQEITAGSKASFSIQGHTSAEGDAAANQQLSERRAARILALLQAQGVPAQTLNAIGLGEDVASFPESAPEAQLQQDRRVLVVRMR